MPEFVKDQRVWHYPGGDWQPTPLYYEGPASASHMVNLWCKAGEVMTKHVTPLPRGHVFTSLEEAQLFREHFLRARYVKLKREAAEKQLALENIEYILKKEGLEGMTLG